MQHHVLPVSAALWAEGPQAAVLSKLVLPRDGTGQLRCWIEAAAEGDGGPEDAEAAAALTQPLSGSQMLQGSEPPAGA